MSEPVIFSVARLYTRAQILQQLGTKDVPGAELIHHATGAVLMLERAAAGEPARWSSEDLQWTDDEQHASQVDAVWLMSSTTTTHVFQQVGSSGSFLYRGDARPVEVRRTPPRSVRWRFLPTDTTKPFPAGIPQPLGPYDLRHADRMSATVVAKAAGALSLRTNESPAPTGFYLEWLDADGKRTTFAIPRGKPVTLGRGREVDVYIARDDASRTHCSMLYQDEEKILVQDLGSSAGTVVNGYCLEGKEVHQLRAGDRVGIGRTVLTLRNDARLVREAPLVAEAAAPAAPPQHTAPKKTAPPEGAEAPTPVDGFDRVTATVSSPADEPPVDSPCAATIQRKLIDAGGSAEIPCRRRRFQAEVVVGGVRVSNLSDDPFLPWAVFDQAFRLMLSLNGRAPRGDASKFVLGGLGLPLASVEGFVASTVFNRSEGDEVYRRIVPIARLLVWAGVCTESRGDLVLISLGGTPRQAAPPRTVPSDSLRQPASVVVPEPVRISDEDRVQRVLRHIRRHGSILETEVALLLGGQRALRRFSRELETVAAKADMKIRIDSTGGIKRYVGVKSDG